MDALTLEEYWKLQDLVERVFQFYKFNKCSSEEHSKNMDKACKQIIKMMEYAWDQHAQTNNPPTKED